MKTYQITAEKRRSGERITGIIHDDGLQSLWACEQADGTIAYISVLDRIISKEEVAA